MFEIKFLAKRTKLKIKSNKTFGLDLMDYFFMKEHFVFYDFETTGKSTKFDQPLQFGAIVTDGTFNEVERLDIRCQLAPHILPAPFALHVTRVKPEQTLNKNLPKLI